MNDKSESCVVFDDNCLDDILEVIRATVHEAWGKGYQTDIDVEFKFEKIED